MEFDTSSPIWVQIVREFTRRIIVGEWLPGTKIPGVRDLAAELGVNPNTAQRALAELERDNLCRSERTAGRFVTDDTERIQELRAELAQDAADAFIARAQSFGMQQTQAVALIQERWTNHGNRHDHGGA